MNNLNVNDLVFQAQGVTGISLARLLKQVPVFPNMTDAVLAVQDSKYVSGQTVRYSENGQTVRDVILDVQAARNLVKKQGTLGINVFIALGAQADRINSLIRETREGTVRGVMATAPATSEVRGSSYLYQAPAEAKTPETKTRTLLGNTQIDFLKLETMILERMIQRDILSGEEEASAMRSLYERIAGRSLEDPLYAEAEPVESPETAPPGILNRDTLDTETTRKIHNTASKMPPVKLMTVSEFSEATGVANHVIGQTVGALSNDLGFDIRGNDLYCQPYYNYGSGDRYSKRNIERYRLTEKGVAEVTRHLMANNKLG